MALNETILIVDDSTFIVEGLVAILRKNYRTLAVYGGQQCLDMLTQQKPSIIILDIMMEPMDGWETLSHIKENPETRHIPVLMFSAKKVSAEELEEHMINIDDFVSKPVTPKKLIESIEKVLARQKTNRLNIETWRSAGIGEDRINEYTSLMTSLEVDMNLLQNMKVQHSLVHGDDEKIRHGLEDVITAIEGRIQVERLHEEELCRGMQESVARDAELKERVVPAPPWDTSEPEINTLDRRTQASVEPEPVFSKDVAHSEIPEVTKVHEIPLTDGNLPVVGTIPVTPGTGSPVAGSATPSSTSEDIVVDVPADPPAAEPGRTPGISTAPVSNEIPRTISISQKSSTALSEGVTDIASEKNTSPVLEQQSPPLRKPRPISSRTIDNKPIASDEPLPPAIGSGTDTNPLKSPRSPGRSYGNQRTDPKEKREPARETHSTSESFISRIISTILGIFKRK